MCHDILCVRFKLWLWDFVICNWLFSRPLKEHILNLSFVRTFCVISRFLCYFLQTEYPVTSYKRDTFPNVVTEAIKTSSSTQNVDVTIIGSREILRRNHVIFSSTFFPLSIFVISCLYVEWKMFQDWAGFLAIFSSSHRYSLP